MSVQSSAVPALIGGQWEVPLGTDVFPCLVDPNTGAPVKADPTADSTVHNVLTVRNCSNEQIERAIACAKSFDASVAWGVPPPTQQEGGVELNVAASALQHRYNRLLDIVAAMEANHAEFALIDAVETGVPLPTAIAITSGYGPAARSFLASALAHLSGMMQGQQASIPGRYGAPIVRRVVPMTPAVIIAPWNVPFGTILPKLFVALLSGCAVLLKPSEYASRGICMMCQRLTALGLLPTGSVQVLVGGPDVGKALVASRHVCCVQFTGASSTAATIGANCAAYLRPFHAECGGSNAALLGPNANVDLAVQCVTMGLTTLNGQWCMGISRMIVHHDIFPQFLQKLQSRLNDVIRMVSSTDAGEELEDHPEKVLVGPMAFAAHAARLEELCKECGGEPLLLGEFPDHLRRANEKDGAAFFQPRLLLHPDNKVIAHRELFGPVAGIAAFTGSLEVEGAALVNEATGQLAAYVFDDDVEKLYRDVAPRIRAGMVMLNSVNFCFEVADGEVEPHGDFLGTAGQGRDGNGKALAAFFNASAWIGVNGPS